MRRIIIWAAILICICATATAGGQETLPLTTEILESGRWAMHWTWYRYITFAQRDGVGPWFEVWSVDEEGPDYRICEGPYIIEDNTLRFTLAPGSSPGAHIDSSYFEQSAVRLPYADGLEYAEYLDLQPLGHRFYNRKARVQTGDARVYKDIPVVIIRRYGTVTANLRVREGPTVSAAPVKLPLRNNATVYPAGTRVYVIARTRDRKQIGDWHNYWYLVPVAEHVMSSPESPDNAKWVFGEFVDLD